MAGALVVVGEAVGGRRRSRSSPPSTRTISGPSATGSAAAGAVDLDAARSPRPSAAAAASSRCAGARGRAASRRRSRRASSGSLGIELDLVEHLEGPLADLVHVGAHLVGRAGSAARRGSCAGSRSRRRSSPSSPRSGSRPPIRWTSQSSSKLAMWPRSQIERAEDRRVDAVELLVRERLDQLEGARARLRQALGDLGLAVGAGRATVRCDAQPPRCRMRPLRDRLAAAVDMRAAPMRIEGASALVAGGASGLGAATARALHERGASVVIADLNAEKGEALAAELGERAALRRGERDGARAGAGGGRRRRGRPTAGCGSRSAAPGIGWAQRTASQAGPARPRDLPQRDQGQPDRHLQRAAARLRGDGRTTSPTRRASAASASTPPRSPPSTARSARSPTRPRRAASSA